jgi:hypothetical protein
MSNRAIMRNTYGMEFVTHSYKNGDAIIKSNPEINYLWHELTEIIRSISDEELIEYFENSSRKSKSISDAINKTIDAKLTASNWKRQSRIFKDRDTYVGTTWTLDFSKSVTKDDKVFSGIAVEVVFNHGEAIAWNLIKLSMAAEQNHVRKETDIGDGVGIYICATDAMKEKGGFDGAIGEYEKVLKYLEPLSQKIITPTVIIGLEAPKTFYIEHFSDPKNLSKKLGRIIRYQC